MKIGVDFDNTIVSYDSLFFKIALEKKLIPGDLAVTKNDVRDHLRKIDREDDWTEMQGYVYGARMNEADPFPGVLDFFLRLKSAGLPFVIVSHKTRYPYMGEKYDLHASARGWLKTRGFFSEQGIDIGAENVFFEPTKHDKLRRIGAVGCTHFIDDLPEFLGEESFPARVERILFDPGEAYPEDRRFLRKPSWSEIEAYILAESRRG